jgi:hypothetical protein
MSAGERPILAEMVRLLLQVQNPGGGSFEHREPAARG